MAETQLTILTVKMLVSHALHVSVFYAISIYITMCSKYYMLKNTSDNCQDGDVRLIGGQSAYEGRLEVCLSRRWGAVSDEEWSIFDAQVACKQLGYKSSG